MYQAIVYDELDDADKAAYAKKYSGLASLGLLYVCDPTYLTSVQRSLLEEVSAALSIDESFISREEAQGRAPSMPPGPRRRISRSRWCIGCRSEIS